MEEHFIHSRPMVVTEDRLKEAVEKQAKQKALRAALDRQVREAERLKAEAHRSKGRREKSPGSPKKNVSPVKAQRDATETVADTVTSVPGPSPPTAANTATIPAPGEVEATRYTFSFDEGHAKFEVESASVRRLQATLPPSAEGRERGGRTRSGAPAASLGVGSEVAKDPLAGRRVPSSKEGDRASGKRAARASKAGAAEAASGGEHQSNSLPVGFSMGRKAASRQPASREHRNSDSNRASRSISREKARGDGGRGGRHNDSESGTYDTQSLPVELIYKLGQANANGVPKPSSLAAGTPQRSSSNGHTPEPSSRESPLAGMVGASSGTPTSLLRDRMTPLNGDRVSGSDWSGHDGGRAARSPRGGKSGARVQGSGDGTPSERATAGPSVSPRPSARPAGGLLPPLVNRHDSDVIEMSAVLEALTPTREYSVAAAPPYTNGRPHSDGTPPASRIRTGSTPSDRVLRPSSPPSPREASAAELARKQAEREKAWAQQVKQLKAELRKARAKRSGEGGAKAEAGAVGDAPRRAETAPDPLPHPPLRGGLGGMVASPGTSGAAHGRNVGGGVRGQIGNNRAHLLEKMDFSKARIFTRENFRPITAPEDMNAYFGSLSPLPTLPPLAQTPPTKSRAKEHPGERESDVGERETNTAVEKSSSLNMIPAQTFTSTATSIEESLKLASLTTRQVMLGLPDYGASEPVPIQYSHLYQFVEAQMITPSQAEGLWNFFTVLAEAGQEDVHHGGEGASATLPRPVAEHARWVQAPAGPNDSANEISSISFKTEGMDLKDAASSRPNMATSDTHQNSGGSSGTSNNGKTLFAPHSPLQQPLSAVLAPALRRKISLLNSKTDTSSPLQPQKPLHNGRRRPSPSSGGEKAANGGGAPRTSPLKTSPTSPQSPVVTPSSDGEEVAATFDTYSELVLPTDEGDDED